MALSTESSISEFGNLSVGVGGGQKFHALGETETGEVIAAVTGMKIRILGMLFQQETDAASTWQFTDGSGGTALTGEMTGAAVSAENTTFTLPFSPAGWFETTVGTALYVTIGGGPVNGIIVYQEIP